MIMHEERNQFLTDLGNRMDVYAAEQNALNAYREYVDSVGRLNELRNALGVEQTNKGYFQAKKGVCLPKANKGDNFGPMPPVETDTINEELLKREATPYDAQVDSMIKYAERNNFRDNDPLLVSDEQVSQTQQSEPAPQFTYQPGSYSFKPIYRGLMTRTDRRIANDRARRFEDFYGSSQQRYDNPDAYEAAKQNYMATGIDRNIEERMRGADRKDRLYRANRFERRGYDPSVYAYSTNPMQPVPTEKVVEEDVADESAPKAEVISSQPAETITTTSSPATTNGSNVAKSSSQKTSPATANGSNVAKSSSQKTTQATANGSNVAKSSSQKTTQAPTAPQATVVQEEKPSGTQPAATQVTTQSGSSNNPQKTRVEYPTEFIKPHSKVLFEGNYFEDNPYGVMENFISDGYDIIFNGNRTYIPKSVYDTAQKYNKNLHSLVSGYYKSSTDNPYTVYDESELNAIKDFSSAPVKKGLPVYVNYKGNKYRITNGKMAKAQYGGSVDDLMGQYSLLNKKDKELFLSKLGLR